MKKKKHNTPCGSVYNCTYVEVSVHVHMYILAVLLHVHVHVHELTCIVISLASKDDVTELIDGW